MIKNFILCFGLFFMSLGYSMENPGEVRVGLAKINVTPQEPVALMGYSDRDSLSTGVHDSLYVRTLVFDDGAEKAALISVDVIGFKENIWTEITDRLETELDLKKENILLSGTHTHSGPGPGRSNTKSSVDRLFKEKIVTAIKEASKSMIPFKIGAGTGECKYNINRRSIFPDGRMWLGANPDAVCDHTLGVVKLTDMNDRPLAIWVNWPCHGTITRSDNYHISGDWLGVTSLFIEDQMNKSIIAPVTAGASGNLNPIYRPKGDRAFNAVNITATAVTQKTLRVVENIDPMPPESINALQRVISLPGKNPSWPKEVKNETAPDLDVRLSALRVGKIVFVGVSGEVFTEIGLAVKERSPYKYTFMITHCNGSSGYLVTDEAYDQGGYEVQATRAKSGVEQGIVDNLIEMINGL